MGFLLDEGVNPVAAAAARGLHLDAVSVHEVGRTGQTFSHDSQLRWAASQQRVLVTRNRDDFIRLTRDFFQAGEPHYGILILQDSLQNRNPEELARALREWQDMQLRGVEPERYVIEFLGDQEAAPALSQRWLWPKSVPSVTAAGAWRSRDAEGKVRTPDQLP